MRAQQGGAGPDFLARRGGSILVVWGVILVALACVFQGQATIAPIFAFTGVASVVLGVLAARFEGDFELSATGLKGKLLAVAEREDLTLEEKGDALVRIVARETSRIVDRDTAVEQRVTWSRQGGLSQRGLAFGSQVTEWFQSDGWQIEPPIAAYGQVGDFMARKDGETLLVNVMARSGLRAADIWASMEQAADVLETETCQMPGFKLAVALPEGSLRVNARQADALRRSSLPVQIVEVAERAGPDW